MRQLTAYIATVWRYDFPSEGEPEWFEPEWFGRVVERRFAASVEEFRQALLDEYADDEVTIGPISVSKRQD